MKLGTFWWIASTACGAHPVATPATPATSAVAANPIRPSFDPATDLLQPPGDYRAWRYLTSGFQMGYGPAAVAAAADGIASYDTVFVDPAAYETFATTGAWPDRTMFVLEVRTSEHTGSIVSTGYYQTDRMAVEAEIKDARVPGGWAFFAFDVDPAGALVAAKRLPTTVECYRCHAANAAVENTFTQFYPTLLPIARAHGTVRPDFVGIPPSVDELHHRIVAEGFAAAATWLDAAIAKWPAASIAREGSLNRLGYTLVREHRVALALDVFADVPRRFPESPNAWDSYAETLEGAGKRAEAAAATVRGLAVIDRMPASPRRDGIEKALRERAARLGP